MDEKLESAREAIAKLLFNELGKGFQWQDLLPITDRILSILKKLGYSKVPKLKVLSEPKIESIYMRRFRSMGETYQNLIQAQRDYDQKQIEEAKENMEIILVIVAIGSILANTLLTALNYKLYTEYWKDSTIKRRYENK